MDEAVRIAVVEDNPDDLEVLKRSLARYSKESSITFSITEFQDGEDIAEEYKADYDLILMDIQMTFMNGMDAARKIRSLDPEVVIVFITNAPQYAIEGYQVRALDYILKPISWFSFTESMKRALAAIHKKTDEYVTIALKDGKAKIAFNDICYVEVRDHLLIYSTKDAKYETKGTISEAEEKLSSGTFMRCNRCYLVNLKYVRTYHGCDLDVNGEIIQMSRRQRSTFIDALNRFLNGETP